ncbi:hypothetical protein ACIBCA_01795 [Kitasatospora sp. NPDC051170]|uniref:hypothetical protein n=1 Tax=Kitasatospora sp. NPDC051170 TaxID=3364056 RepID=UPI0037A79603
MIAVPAALLAACLAVGTVPAVGRALSTAAAAFTDRSGYLADTLGRTAPFTATAAASTWTAAGHASPKMRG